MQSFLSKSLFSKILAVENITLVISKEANTASFNYSNRTLTLPDWQTSKSVERLLISHEVAHALFTDSEKRTNFLESYPEDVRKHLARVLNIVEDARIEKLIQRKYVGLKKDYVIGYLELVNNFGFFSNSPYTNIFDKLNHHFKIVVSGQQNNIYNFNSTEEGFVKRMLKMESYDDTLDVTRDLFKLYQEESSEAETSTVFTSDLSGEVDADTEVKFELEAKETEGDGKELNKNYKDPCSIPNYVLNSVNENRYIKKHQRKGFETEAGSSSTVKYMFSVFNKKKNAKNYANQKRMKTGDIDPNGIYRYKYDEKIFETKVIKSKQKNHAVILLVDGSSSMKEVMRAVAIQSYNIAEFCRIAKIPFRCFVFQDNEGTVIEGFNRQSKVKLSEFFSSDSKFPVEMKYMSAMASGGTPLSESLIVLLSLIEQLQKKHDVVNLMVITDGACQNAHITIENLRYKNTYITPGEDSSNTPQSILKVFRDYFGVNVISFDLGRHSCYNSYHNKFGADIHFEVPLNYILEKENSRQFLNELVEIISK